MSIGKLLTRQITHHDMPVEQAQNLLLENARKEARKALHAKETHKTLAQINGDAIKSALDRNDHNVGRAAKELDVSKNTIYRWLHA